MSSFTVLGSAGARAVCAELCRRTQSARAACGPAPTPPPLPGAAPFTWGAAAAGWHAPGAAPGSGASQEGDLLHNNNTDSPQTLADSEAVSQLALRITAALCNALQALPPAPPSPLALPAQGGTLGALCRWVRGLARYEGLSSNVLPLVLAYETDCLFCDRYEPRCTHRLIVRQTHCVCRLASAEARSAVQQVITGKLLPALGAYGTEWQATAFASLGQASRGMAARTGDCCSKRVLNHASI